MPELQRRSTKLQALSALSADVGKGRIRLAKAARQKLAVGTGEAVSVRHAGQSVSLTIFKADKDLVGKGACRLDGETRRRLKLKRDGVVVVSTAVQSTVSINAVIDPRKYDLVVVERSAENPFQISSKLVKTAIAQAGRRRSSKAKARALFDWVHANIQYGGHRPRGIGYRDSVETKVAREGVCGEMAFLYVAMARVVGLCASFVKVDRDSQGTSVRHACAGVPIDGRLILVDPAYHAFDIKHERFKALGDIEAHAAFRSMRAGRPVVVPQALL
ncbi:transglutaminase domain-containing protein [Verrucomicrobiota bacterium]